MLLIWSEDLRKRRLCLLRSKSCERAVEQAFTDQFEFQQHKITLNNSITVNETRINRDSCSESTIQSEIQARRYKKAKQTKTINEGTGMSKRKDQNERWSEKRSDCERIERIRRGDELRREVEIELYQAQSILKVDFMSMFHTWSVLFLCSSFYFLFYFLFFKLHSQFILNDIVIPNLINSASVSSLVKRFGFQIILNVTKDFSWWSFMSFLLPLDQKETTYQGGDQGFSVGLFDNESKGKSFVSSIIRNKVFFLLKPFTQKRLIFEKLNPFFQFVFYFYLWIIRFLLIFLHVSNFFFLQCSYWEGLSEIDLVSRSLRAYTTGGGGHFSDLGCCFQIWGFQIWGKPSFWNWGYFDWKKF
ncbi:hypothetical protein VP01_3999g1 [Puccinia sorghi]|uniref:Uncharacterized protein n=1 Tax=Puccinia sorghi TaxID=27349 RepID=A0A0L6US37_9BASI|nr:hypothetical protein VP01_3999g1 [Puccinia sorghi]